MKALHPADHEIKATRVPGGIDNTLALSIDQVFTVEPTRPGPFPKRFILRPNIMNPLNYEEDLNGNGDFRNIGDFVPPAFNGLGFTTSTIYSNSELDAVMKHIRHNFEAVRITSECVTVHLIAPAVANQGSVIGAQAPSYPQRMYFSATDVDDANLGTAGSVISTTSFGTIKAMAGAVPIDVYDDIPKKTQMLSGTRAYTNEAKEGAYLPLRLNSFEWHNVGRSVVRRRAYASGIGQTARADTPISGWELVQLAPLNGVFNLRDRATGPDWGWEMADIGNTYGIIQFEGLDATASFEVRFRMTLEARVNPGSNYAPLIQAPPLPDELALKMYREISARMKNAYPAAFNSWDTLKGIVMKIGRGLLAAVDPLIYGVTAGLPFGGALAGIGTGITDKLRRKMEQLDKDSKYVMEAEESARLAAITKAAAQIQTAAQTAVAGVRKQRRQSRQQRKRPAQKFPPLPKGMISEQEFNKNLQQLNSIAAKLLTGGKQ